MKIIKTRAEIIREIQLIKNKSKVIGFVPTMGALHDGHISLIRESVNNNDITVVSIFVNPIQFNNKNDLKNYPRDLDQDLKLLKQNGCNIVFCPDENEMYPEEAQEKYDLGGLDVLMEGKFRPGHFQGVVIIVKRLFDLISPDNAYFGRKDFQQLSIIKYLVRYLKLNVNIIGCETIRDNDGLAKSSRNMLLEKSIRVKAAIIPETLFSCKELKLNHSVDEVKYIVEKRFDNILKLEYFEIVDELSLLPVKNWTDSKAIVACIAVWAGNVRLIDNIEL